MKKKGIENDEIEHSKCNNADNISSADSHFANKSTSAIIVQDKKVHDIVQSDNVLCDMSNYNNDTTLTTVNENKNMKNYMDSDYNISHIKGCGNFNFSNLENCTFNFFHCKQ